MIKRVLACVALISAVFVMICSCAKQDTNEHYSSIYHYTVSFSCPEDDTVNGKTVSVYWRNAYNFPMPKREHYKFEGWKYGNDILDVTGVWRYSEDAILTASWIPKTYSISYQMYPFYSEGFITYTIETEGFALDIPNDVQNQMFLGWTGEGIEEPTRYVYIPQGSYGAKTYIANWISIDDIEHKLDGFSLEIVDDHAVIIGYFGEIKDELSIPIEYNGYPVTTIGKSAFYGMGVFTGNLNIPTTISIIEDNAIGGCVGLPISIVDENGNRIDKEQVAIWHENAIIGSNNGGLTK